MQHWSIIGHTTIVRQLERAVMQAEVPHALLITGPENVGKSTLALTLAQALLCSHAEQRPCGRCSVCRRVASGNHPDLLVVAPEEEGQAVKIDQIREVEHYLRLTPAETRYKIAIIFNFDEATVGAANALLKTLEEPPPYAHLILLARDADNLLPTIVSRTRLLPLRPLDIDTIARGLQERWNVPEERARQLARLSGGRLGWAVTATTQPQQMEQMERAIELLFEVLRSDLPTRFALAQELAKDDTLLAQTLEYWRRAWRDVLLLQSGSAQHIIHREQEQALQRIAEQGDVPTTDRLLRALEGSLDSLRRHANTRLLVESLFLELPYL
ncbi:MAG: DNA polymerase III subunit delta' [Anaerolineales bacterium]